MTTMMIEKVGVEPGRGLETGLGLVGVTSHGVGSLVGAWRVLVGYDSCSNTYVVAAEGLSQSHVLYFLFVFRSYDVMSGGQAPPLTMMTTNQKKRQSMAQSRHRAALPPLHLT